MKLGLITKGPADVLDYDVDMTAWLREGDRIDAATATVRQCSVIVDDVVTAQRTIKIWLSGGVDGESGELDLSVTTIEGRAVSLCIRLRVKGC